MCNTVDGRNPANQLRLVVYPMIYSFFIHPRWLARFLPSTCFFSIFTGKITFKEGSL